MHGLRTPREEIAFTARPKIQSQSQIFRYGGSIFCLPHRPNFSDIFDLCLHWVSVVRGPGAKGTTEQAQNLANGRDGPGDPVKIWDRKVRDFDSCPVPSCRTKWNRAEKDVLKQKNDALKQKTMFNNRKGCSKTGK